MTVLDLTVALALATKSLGPGLQNILRFITRLSQVYRTIDLR